MSLSEGWRLFRYLSLRHAAREPGRTFLTVLGVALGVAVLVAIRLGNANTVSAFKQSIEDISGEATIQVRGAVDALDERLLADISLTPGVEYALPVIEQTVTVFGKGDQAGEIFEGKDDLTILGVDLLSDRFVRDYVYLMQETGHNSGPGTESLETGPEAGGRNARDDVSAILDAIADPRAIFITARYARDRGFSVGDTMRIVSGDRGEDVRIRYLLTDEGPASAYSGRIAIMDIAAAQHVLQRYGELDRIDIVHDEDEITVAQLMDKLNAALSPAAVAERPQSRSERAEDMMAAFRFNCNALAGVALLVGAFLIYNSVSISVVRRRQEIGTWRSLGVNRNAIRSVFLAEGAAMGGLGALLGIGLGYVLAQTVVGLVSRAVGYHYVRTEATEAALLPEEILVALALGIGLSILASLAPAIEASRTDPASVARRGSIGTREIRRTRTLLITGIICLVVAALFARLPPVWNIPMFGFASGLLVIGGFAALCSPAVGLLNRLLRPFLERVLGAEGILASASVAGSPGRIAVAVCGLMVGLALVSSIGIMTRSFRQTVDIWLVQMMQADLYLGPPTQRSAAREADMDPAIAEAIAGIDGIADVDAYRGRDILFHDRRVTVGGANLTVFGKYTQTECVEVTMDVAVADALANDHVLLSEPLANALGYKRGDTIVVPTADGGFETRVAGVYYEYSSSMGYINMDMSLYRRLYDDPWINSVGIYLEDRGDAEMKNRISNAIHQILGPDRYYALYDNAELRNAALRVFDETFKVTRALEIIAIIVSVLGVATTLLAVTTDRRDEIVTMRFIGATRGQIARVVLCESALLGIAGAVLGTIAGAILSQLLIFVINKQSFGWSIMFYPPWGLVASLAGLVIVATLLAGWYPAWRAAQVDVRYEKVMG